jgi:Sulfotransferase domain
MEEYPDAKVLLSVRDPHRWYISARNTIFRTVDNVTTAGLDEKARAKFAAMRAVRDAMFVRTFDGRLDEQHAIDVFTQHNSQVQRDVPPDRLLIYQVSGGWTPLCEFLDVDIPDTPFPWTNTTESFAEIRKTILASGESIL